VHKGRCTGEVKVLVEQGQTDHQAEKEACQTLDFR
jgi:hypothetical protein